jgi:hypothetical protein
MDTFDDEIARHLREAAASGELARAPGYGRAPVEDPALAETPAKLRLAFKILKDAGVPPPEVALFNERAALRSEAEVTTDPARREAVRLRLCELDAVIALRLEGLRRWGDL